MFSAEAVKKADTALENLRGQTKWQVVIETVDSLDGRDIDKVKIENAKELNIHGVYILINKEKHGIRVVPSESAQKVFSKEADKAVYQALVDAFKARDYDKGLLGAVALLRKDAGLTPDLKTVAEPPPAPDTTQKAVAAIPPPKGKIEEPPPAEVATSGGGVMILVIVGLGILFVLFMISRIFRRPQVMQQGYPPNAMMGGGSAPRPNPGPNPGYPQPGYGPQTGYGYGPPPPRQGGGFMSGLLGGAGGAIVGNILYDKFGRPHEAPPQHQGGVMPTHGADAPWQAPDAPTESFDPNAGAGGDWTEEPAPDAGNTGGDWGSQAEDSGNTGGDWGGDGGGDAGGGDWGGGDSSPDPSQGGDW